MAKIVLLFIIAIAVLAIIGRIRLPRLFKRNRLHQARKCEKCGAYQFEGVDCSCDKG